MTFRKPVRKDFPDEFAYETYKDSDGCDDTIAGWTPCICGNGTLCNLYGKEQCYHGQGV